MGTTLTFYDGVDTIGGTKIHLESRGRGILLDFGQNFKNESNFYEEYLKPRSTRGIYDYFTLGLLPPLDIYREDLIPADLARKELKAVDLDGVLVTHAHMDHVGYIGLLKREIPIFSSPMSAAILKSIQDTGVGGVPREIAYMKERERTEDEDRVLKSKSYRKTPSSGRDFYLTSRPSEELLDFWSDTPSRRGHEAGKLSEVNENDKPLPFQWFEVSHSIYGATAYCVKTEDGWIVYTGDLRFHGKKGDKTKKFVKEASKLNAKVLITEGTRTGREETENETEEDVYQNCLTATESEDNLVIGDFSPRNLERLETFLKIAEKTGRKLVATTKDGYALDSLRCVDGVDRASRVRVYKDLTVWKRRRKWEKQVLEKFEEQTIDPQEISKNPGQYILCFSFWDIKNLLDIMPEGGSYIYSTSEAYTEEQELDVERLWEWLQFFNLKAVGFELRKENGETKLDFKKGYHCSGHAAPDELLRMIEEIDPEIVVPVHTEDPEFFSENLEGRGVEILQDGDRIELG
ncbi:hypothetical protein AKJ48_00895 [candidate division MSBL1 archaeon SCGC-AAA261O19]|uniref:Metallo-beta-lactamase domain-containing protein n=1 Tax=candidate division MSBL1 archaeon SCGC-AAA261O19 TaxID=1698277 RepID=A0A133VEP3_9EURY|nr:hypothetical protein AKJ48_00895 [candidate division MSBL1 archaeon SCGC-AAA261O19]